MSNIYQNRLEEAYQDILSPKPVSFQIPLNKMLHEVHGDIGALAPAEANIIEFTEKFQNMKALGFAKETLGMNGENLHKTFRQVIHHRCENLLNGFGANRLDPDIREKLLRRKQDLESRFSDLSWS